MRRLTALVVLVWTVGISSPVWAAGYGSAGCGVGGLVVQKNNWLQIFAVTLNGVFSNQLFGISTGTLGCDSGNLGDAVKGAKLFIETNREALAKESARGGGETVVTLASIAGCADSAAVGARLQASYDRIFRTARDSDAEVADRMVEVLRTDDALACAL